jgi:hypothetical protein
LYLSVDCCETIESKIQLSELQLDIPPKTQVTYKDELNLAHHKIDKVQGFMEEHEWQLIHSTQMRHLSIITLVGSALLTLLIGTLCSCCCWRPCCRKCWPSFTKWFHDGNKCSSIVFKPKIINSLLTNEGIYRPGIMLSLTNQVREGSDTEGGATEVTPMYVPTGHRATGNSGRNFAVGKR